MTENNNKISTDIIKKIDQIDDLPAFPVVIERLNAKMRDPDFGIGDLASIIESDPALTVRVLKLANSSFYLSVSGEISSVRQALVRLGVNEVKNICMTMGALNIFARPSNLISLDGFWSHCIGCALMAQEIAAKLPGANVKDAGTAFTGGLLHDIGVLILDHYFHDIYAKIRKAAQESKKSIQNVEEEILGMNHGTITARVLRRWNLPAILQNIVQYHHHPDECPVDDKRLCQVLHIADFIISSQGLYEPGDFVPEQSSEGAWHDLGLKVEDMPDLLGIVEKEVERTKTLLGMTGGET